MPDRAPPLPGRTELAARLAHARAITPGRLVLTTSFGIEDQLLTHAAVESGCEIEFVTLDTGRLFPETYEIWEETERRYGIRVRAHMPETRDVEALIARNGINGFRASVPNRVWCCHVRKVEPLARALSGVAGWISGLRADQSQARGGTGFVARDDARNLLRITPLFDWTRAEVTDAIRRHGIPYNRLHDSGMLSIGCQPCTRAVLPGEDERAGRWWWEQGGARECGLHPGPDGRLHRAAAPAAASGEGA